MPKFTSNSLLNKMLQFLHLRPKKRFKLLQLPCLAGEELLKSMSPRDIFALSLCSKKMFRMIASYKLELNRLCFCYDNERNNLSIFHGHRYDDEYIFFIKHVEQFKRLSKKTNLTLGGVVRCAWGKTDIEYIDKNEDFIQSVTQNHLMQLFKITEIDLVLSKEHLSEGVYPNIKNVTDICINATDIESNRIEEIVEKYPNLKSMVVNGPFIGEVSFNSDFFHIDHVVFRRSRQMAFTFLINFTGRSAFFIWTGSSDMFMFLIGWITGNICANLRRLHIVGSFIDTTSILNAFRPVAIQWDRPEVFKYKTRAIGDVKDMDEMKFDSDLSSIIMDIERRTDKKKATFVARDNFFDFCVWD